MGAWTEIVDWTATSTVNSITFNNFGEITKDDFIKIVFTHVNSQSGSRNMSLYPNTTSGVSGHNTNSNYTYQRIGGTDNSPSPTDRFNVNYFTQASANTTNTTIGYFKISENGKTNHFSNRIGPISSDINLIYYYCTSSNLTFNNAITSLTFAEAFGVTNAISTGSRIQIYRLDAEKVADITVGSNTTQVDISSLSIDKDSEYLLTFEIVGATNSHFVDFSPNDLTNQNEYYTQRITGNGSSATADRGLQLRIAEGISSERSLGYVHIKLSNIGAFTTQSYSTRGMGSSSIQLQNFFGSSITEAITLVTKLNIIGAIANTIGSGSRFILYKLK